MSFGPYYCKGSDKKTENLVSFGSSDSTTIKSTDAEFRLENKEVVIDVVNDFVWTSSPTKNSAETIPVLYAIELRQEQSSIVSSALYYINAIASAGVTSKAIKSIDHLLHKCGTGEKPLEGLKARLNKLIEGGADKELLGKYLKSYTGLYFTAKTGFQYAFPYFEGIPHDISSTWGSTAQIKNPITSTLEKGMEWIDAAASTLNIMTPGTYIEKPRYFQYPTEGESITIKLPLLNTLRKNQRVPYQQNYELLWILAYQNKPFRTSFSRILPPKLYAISIPGIKYMPYSYISKMSVNFLGTRRQLPVRTPKGTIITSIPEAYDVSLTFTSLLADTGNLMINDGFDDKIKVTVRR